MDYGILEGVPGSIPGASIRVACLVSLTEKIMNTRSRSYTVLTLALVAIASLAFTSAPANANMIANGGFDDSGGGLGSWTMVGSNGAVWKAETSRGQIGGPQAGTHFAINSQNGGGAWVDGNGEFTSEVQRRGKKGIDIAQKNYTIYACG